MGQARLARMCSECGLLWLALVPTMPRMLEATGVFSGSVVGKAGEVGKASAPVRTGRQ